MSIYSPEQKITVFCQKCWWADDWDGTEYAQDYDSSRPFLSQVRDLMNRTPYSALESQYLTIKNSEYSNALAWSKDSYLIFWADNCESVFYSSILNGLKWSSDCLRVNDSELCYESVGMYRCYNTFFSDECDDCVDMWFSRDCYGCMNCLGCVNLRGAKNCIFNVQYSKEEYEKKFKELGLESWDNLRKFEKKAHEFWLSKPYREYNGNSLNINSTGEHVYNSKNSKKCYIVKGAENCKWTQLVTYPPAKDCYDYSGWGNNAARIYESVTVGENADSVYFSNECWPDVLNLQYCQWVIAGKNNFGCVNLKRKKYAILNKEYPKEEYEELKEKIIEDMKTNPYTDKLGRKFSYGEFFPPEMSNYPYNKSVAMRFFPKTKEEALVTGYTWDDAESPVHPATIKSQDLVDTIKETTNAVLNEIIECASCKRGYKIVRGELNLLRKMRLSLPHECPKCRENKRFGRMTKPGMYHRTCDKCRANIYTPYAPGRPEIVYCVKCYQAEFA
ncbi:hypothetical protein A2740_02135 [Candidatus Nomurabacteria bacterium RIFCSPHIGHO2_01_FULL_43_16]|nr:MAG: hypothetical protein A2740_02135 [Candidatus Nomurabacteria bacterium RIFCSPHIGHO2_01_FULL_43_16]